MAGAWSSLRSFDYRARSPNDEIRRFVDGRKLN